MADAPQPNVLTQEETDKLVNDCLLSAETIAVLTAAHEGAVKVCEDLQAELDKANGVIADKQIEINDLKKQLDVFEARQNVAKVPASITGVTTRNIEDLPRVDQFRPHPTLEDHIEAMPPAVVTEEDPPAPDPQGAEPSR